MREWPEPSLRHVARLTDDIGIVEHALFEDPRRELEYCTDDAGRALALATTLSSDPEAPKIARVALAFLERAHLGAGRFRLRLGRHGRWTPDPPSDDAGGRALLGLGTAAAHAPWDDVRSGALALFEAAADFSSPHPRAMAYASLGALELLAGTDVHRSARQLVRRAADALPASAPDSAWRWPAERLTYANALLPEAAMAVAAATGHDAAVVDALSLLDWLVAEESLADHFSFTPVGGRGPHDPKPAFDQQPIEASAMTDACARAFMITGDVRWADASERAAGWFLGANDVGVAMFDPASGGGFDGLEPAGVNENQGAESALAFAATMAKVASMAQGSQAARSSAAAASRSSR
ncbi:MAG: glycosyltransferase [Actinomycetota bacterium]